MPNAEPSVVGGRDEALALVPVSRETAARLDAFVALLLRWQARMNLISPASISNLWMRHVADSLQLLPLVPGARRWADLGTGGGFPGVVIACALAGEPGASVSLVEKSPKKCAFLREAVRELRLPALVHNRRIEEFCASHAGPPYDVVTARALAPLCRLLALAAPLLKSGAQGLFAKGQDVEAELTAASKCWNIQVTLVPSRTDPRGRILHVHGLAPAGQGGPPSPSR